MYNVWFVILFKTHFICWSRRTWRHQPFAKFRWIEMIIPQSFIDIWDHECVHLNCHLGTLISFSGTSITKYSSAFKRIIPSLVVWSLVTAEIDRSKSSVLDKMQTEYGEELWKALQICDSSFPGGSFAHSFGLESALNHRFVTEEVGTLDSFVLLTLEQANSQLIPFVVSAHNLYFCSSSADLSHPVNLGRDDILNEFTIIDGTCHISLTNEVARRSSINQGGDWFYLIWLDWPDIFAAWEFLLPQ